MYHCPTRLMIRIVSLSLCRSTVTELSVGLSGFLVLAMVSILIWFVLSKMPSRNPRTQRRMARCINDTYCILWRINYQTVLLLLIEAKTTRKTMCEFDTMRIECPHGHAIDVVDVFYGRLEKITCPLDGNMGDTSCSLADAIDIVRPICQNQTTCSLQAPPNDVDPCWGVYKYLRVTYACRRK